MGDIGAASPAARAMMRWLADKGPDVWFALTPLLRGDRAIPVLQWIASQPHTAKANAAMIFWLASPGAHARKLASGQTPRGEGAALIATILQRWRNGLYTRSELAWPDADGRAAIAAYEREVAAVPGARDVLAFPKELFGPFAGRAPDVPPSLNPANNPQLWDLLRRLGPQVGPRRGEGREPRAAAPRTDGAEALEKPGWSWGAAFWLALSAALIILAIVKSVLD